MTFIKTTAFLRTLNSIQCFPPSSLGDPSKVDSFIKKNVSCCFLFLLIGFRSVMTRIHGDPIAAGVAGTVWGPSQGSTVHVQYGKRHRWTSEGASPNITIYLYIIPKHASFNTGCMVALATVRKLFGPQRAPPGSLWFDLVAVLFLGSRQPLRSTQQKRTTSNWIWRLVSVPGVSTCHVKQGCMGSASWEPMRRPPITTRQLARYPALNRAIAGHSMMPFLQFQFFILHCRYIWGH